MVIFGLNPDPVVFANIGTVVKYNPQDAGLSRAITKTNNLGV